MKKFERFIKIINNNSFNNLQNKTVLIVGIGGVGGYALEGIVRSGINNIIIIDHDIIDETNINRQIISNEKNIGKKKVIIAKKRILDINSNCNIQIYDVFLTKNNITDILNKHKIDYIIDACDTVSTKKEIILYSIKNKIKFVSCMGTANKLNPELLNITDIRKTKYDKLAKVIRKWVVDEKIKEKIPVVSSTEECIKIGSLGSTSFVPSIAGMLCASYIINDIIKEK